MAPFALSYSVPTQSLPNFPNRTNGQALNTVAFAGSGFPPGASFAAQIVTDGGTTVLGSMTADQSGNVNATFAVTDPTARPRLSMLGPGSWTDTNSQWACGADDGAGGFIQLAVRATMPKQPTVAA